MLTSNCFAAAFRDLHPRFYKRADIILMDMAKPHLYPFAMPLSGVACFANG